MYNRATTWTYEFGERPWASISSLLGGMAANHPEFQYLADVIDSITESGSDQLLAGSTSMHDLMVVPRPVVTPVREMIVVRAPASLGPTPAGYVRIQHLSSTGRDDCIDRPPSEAVPLFWRFVIEKYGVRPPKSPT